MQSFTDAKNFEKGTLWSALSNVHEDRLLEVAQAF